LLNHAELEAASVRGISHDFFRVEGPGIHEVAVGPVHAGIIEPGHFRFQCSGETVLHLEIQLGYQHRGAEALLLNSLPARRLVVAESIAGDTAIGHATAYCEAIEALAGAEIPPRAQAVRAMALELERVANHVGDLGALCGDIGYLPGASYLGRLRGEFLNLLLELSGNRFGRGLLVPGGVRFDLDERMRADFAKRLASAQRHFEAVADLVFSVPSVLSRFEQTGPLSRETAEELGLVGPAARASGCTRDVRVDHPSGFYRFAHIPVARLEGGDVFARAMVRLIEARRSIAFVREEIERIPKGAIVAPVGSLAASAVVVALVEGWRGEIAHLAVTDSRGTLQTYRIADPSLHNWFGLAMAMRGQQISDFPLCNKSFNLSYAGHDR
jgi:Ni,Fe-hydrogenase III large subunit